MEETNLIKRIINFNYILKFLGHRWINTNKYILKDIIIHNNNNSSPDIDYKQASSNSKYKSINYCNKIYNIIVGLLILFPFAKAIIVSIYEKNASILFNNMYQLLFFIQYCYGLIYFKKDHLSNKIKEKSLKKIYSISIFLGFILSIILSILSTVLLNYNYNIASYSDIYVKANKIQRIFISILLLFEKIYSYCSFFTNLITFTIIMKYHRLKISVYCQYIEKINSSDTSHIINKVINDYTSMKNDFKLTIKQLNDIFSTFNFIGVLSIFFTFRQLLNKETNIINIINLVILCIIEIIYIYSIYYVRNDINTIKDRFIASNFINQIMSNKNMNDNIIENDSLLHNQSSILYNTLVITNISKQGISYIILDKILSSEWDTFNIFGFPITDSYIIQKIVAFILTYLFANDLGNILD
jgi:hypothetical protein